MSIKCSLLGHDEKILWFKDGDSDYYFLGMHQGKVRVTAYITKCKRCGKILSYYTNGDFRKNIDLYELAMRCDIDLTALGIEE